MSIGKGIFSKLILRRVWENYPPRHFTFTADFLCARNNSEYRRENFFKIEQYGAGGEGVCLLQMTDTAKPILRRVWENYPPRHFTFTADFLCARNNSEYRRENFFKIEQYGAGGEGVCLLQMTDTAKPILRRVWENYPPRRSNSRQEGNISIRSKIVKTVEYKAVLDAVLLNKV